VLSIKKERRRDMSKKGVWLILSGLLAAVMVLGSCGPAEEAEEEAEVEEITKPTAEEPQYGGTLNILTVYAGIDAISWDQGDICWMHNHSASPLSLIHI